MKHYQNYVDKKIYYYYYLIITLIPTPCMTREIRPM